MNKRIFVIKISYQDKYVCGEINKDVIIESIGRLNLDSITISETTKTHEAEQALLAVAIKQQCHCNGTGKYEGNCRFCGDSTYDHECVYPMYDCLDEMCLARRKLRESWSAK